MAARFVIGAEGGQAASPPPPPVWLPRAPSGDYPVIYADFKNGHYWGNGAETTPDLLFEHNANWGDYNPASIQAGLGLGPTTILNSGDAWPQVVASFYGTLLTTGATFVLTGHASNITTDSYFDIEADLWDDPGYTAQYGAFVQDFFSAWSGSGSPGQFVQIYNAAANADNGPLASAAHDIKLAYSAISSPMFYSLNGGATTSISSESPPNPWTNIGLTVHNNTTPGEGFMTSIAIYAPQPNTDLPTLSTP